MTIVYFIAMVLLVIALIDLKTFNIYDITIFILFILTIIYRLLTSFDILDMIAGSLVISSLMMGINIFIKDGFGIGDIELMFVSGILLGFNNIIIAFMIAIITGVFIHYFYCY
ncbi:prepilin peptidase [Coprobacillaceae bacterium CR2/5/TPMF4]|nr:prepilin peptidase [Coprobacillaceae bacterium CR2/5/TPMF4]